MNYVAYHPVDLVNGTGVRCTLFISGCGHACPGCHNPVSWKKNAGHPVTPELIEQILDDLENADGLSLSGGDPLFPPNRGGVTALIQAVRARYGYHKTIWVWTGYLLEELPSNLLRGIDMLIDGPYQQDNPTDKPFRGSDNQRRWMLRGDSPLLID